MARMPSARALVIGNDDAPDFELTISGKDAGTGTQLYDAIRPLVASVMYEEDEDMSALFELTIINQPDDTLGVPVDWTAVLESKAFQEGNFVDLWMGYGYGKAYMGRIETVKWLPKFPQDGPANFTLQGFDGRHKMTIGNQFKVKQKNKRKKRKTFYTNTADEDIVKRIADKYGYVVDVDRTEAKKHVRVGSDGKKKAVFKTRVQASNVTDWDFLKRLADINRFDLWVDYSLSKKNFVVHFKKRQDIGTPEFLFTYNGRDGSLMEAEPDFAITDQVTDVEVLLYDHKKKKIERSIISDLNPAENVKFTSAAQGRFKVSKAMGVGARVRFSAFGQTIEAFSDKPFKSKAEAETFVKNWIRERERDLIILSGRVVGIETLRPRQVHQIEGLGKRIDGLYRFTQVRHEMSPGKVYSCKFVANKILSEDISRRKATTKVVNTASEQVAG